MIDERIYLPTSAWRSYMQDVTLLSANAEVFPAIYTVLVSPIDVNEPGAVAQEMGVDYWLKDFVGHTYRITEINVGGNPSKIKIEDSLGCGQGPQSGQQGIIYKSVGDGTSPYLAPIYYRHLDKSALEYSRQFELDILWNTPDETNIKWAPEGIVFSASKDNQNSVSYTSGSVKHLLWHVLSDYKADNVVGSTNYHPERSWSVTGNTVTLGSNATYYIYFKVPISDASSVAEVVFSTDLRHERYYNGYINILAGVCNAPNPYRTFSLLWSNFNETRFLLLKAIEEARELTGFIDPAQIVSTYSHASRTITLSGDLSYYWRGERKSLPSGWTSAPHPNTTGRWYLMSVDGINFIWSNTPWIYSYIQVAFVNYRPAAADTFAVRETHGLMSWLTHEEFHQTQGTYLLSGGKATVGTYQLDTPSDDATTPGFDQAQVKDEDLVSTIPSLNQGSYTTMSIGPLNTSVFTRGNAFPFMSAGDFLQINDPLLGTMANGINQRFYNVYQVLIPVTSDASSQQYRMVFLQPQQEFLTENDAIGEDVNGLNFGELGSFTEEYKVYARLTYETLAGYANTGKCTLSGITYILGTRVNSINVGNIVSTNHAALSNLIWTQSAHTGAFNKIAAFDTAGAAIYLDNYLDKNYWNASFHPVTTAGYGLPDYPTTLPASDVYSWAKEPVKPTYNTSEVNPTTNRNYITNAQLAALHDPVTLGTANGLSLSGQQLSLGLSSATTVGALSAEDWNTFNNKQPAGNYEPANINIQQHISSLSNPHNVTSTQVGLGNVTNDAQVKRTEMGAVNGVATLDANGKLPSSQVPSLSIVDTFVVSTLADRLTLTQAEKGDVAIVTSENRTYILQNEPYSVASNWQLIRTPDSPVQSVNGQTGNVSLTTTNIAEGLNLYYTEERVTNHPAVLANTAKVSNATHFGDVTGSVELTLKTVNSNIGTFNNVTVNAKGLVTSASNVSYLTSYTETDPVWTAQKVNYYTKTEADNLFSLKHTHPYLSDSDPRITQWTTAYGWGNHAVAGYITGITKAMVEAVLTGVITSHSHESVPFVETDPIWTAEKANYPLKAGSESISGAWNFTTAPTIGGNTIYTTANHMHRTDAQNDVAFIRASPASTQSAYIDINSYVQASTVKLTSLSNGKIPVHSSLSAGMVNSNITQSSNNNILIATSSEVNTVDKLQVAGSVRLTPDGGVVKIGIDDSGRGASMGSKISSDGVVGSTTDYGMYIAYDCYYNEATASWVAMRPSLGSKWKYAMGYHTGLAKWSYSTSGNPIAWTDVMTLNSSGNLVAIGTLQGTTGKFTSLSDGFLPYHVNDSTGLSNSVVYTDGSSVGVGNSAPGYLMHLTKTLSAQETIPLVLHNADATDNTAVSLGFQAIGGNVITGKISDKRTSSGNYSMFIGPYNNFNLLELKTNGASIFSGSLQSASLKATNLAGTGSRMVVADATGLLGIGSESDPVYTASTWYGTSNNASNWNTAFSWGNHATAGYFTLPALTSGSVIFSNGTTLSQNNANFYWDNSNNRLGIGTNAPSSSLSFGGNQVRSIFMEDATTANSNGNQLTITAGAGTLGATNRTGGALTLRGGLNRGSAAGGDIQFMTSRPVLLGTILSATVAGSGGGFSVGQTFTINGGSGGTGQVTSVNSGMGFTVTGVTITNGGSGYTHGATVTTSLISLTITLNVGSSTTGTYVNSMNIAASNGFVGIGYLTDPASGNRLGVNGAVHANGQVFATSFVKSGGTSVQYLMADGSVTTSSNFVYKGEVNGATGVPLAGGSALVNGTGTLGWFYACSVAGTRNYGAGNITLAVGDWIYYNGSAWLRIPGAGGYNLPTASSTTKGGIRTNSAPAGGIPLAMSSEFAYADLTKELIEYHLTGDITSHTHPIYVPYVGATANVNIGSVYTVTANNFILSSDRRLKERIRPIKGRAVERIKLVEFRHKSDARKLKRYGVVAQQVEKVMPELVNTDENGEKSVKYIDLLVAKIDNLEKRIKQLEKNGYKCT